MYVMYYCAVGLHEGIPKQATSEAATSGAGSKSTHDGSANTITAGSTRLVAHPLDHHASIASSIAQPIAHDAQLAVTQPRALGLSFARLAIRRGHESYATFTSHRNTPFAGRRKSRTFAIASNHLTPSYSSHDKPTTPQTCNLTCRVFGTAANLPVRTEVRSAGPRPEPTTEANVTTRLPAGYSHGGHPTTHPANTTISPATNTVSAATSPATSASVAAATAKH